MHEANIVLFFLSHAGGDATETWGWKSHLLENVQLVPITLPGRGNRFIDPCVQTLSEAVEFSVEEINKYEVGPHDVKVLMGHSFGAVLALEIANKRTGNLGSNGPSLVIVSGCPSPQEFKPSGLSQLSDEKLLQWMISSAQMSECTSEQKEMFELLMPVVRLDLELYDSFDPHNVQPVDCPLVAISGADDTEAKPQTMESWDLYTGADFTHIVISADHFFTSSDNREFLNTLNSVLEKYDPQRKRQKCL